jgi:hypothetical protein
VTTILITGQAGVHQMLAPYTAPRLPKRMQAVTKAGATVFKAPLKAEAGKVSKRLARSVSVRTAAKDKPATVVTFRPKIAFFRHWIIGGTRDHGPKSAKALVFKGKDGNLVVTGRVRGVQPNPIVDRVVARYEGRAYDAMSEALDKQGATE